MDISKTVSISRACEMTGVSRRTIYNWMANEKLQWIRTAGGSRRILVDTLFRAQDRTSLPVYKGTLADG